MNKPDVLRVTNDQNPAIAESMRDVKVGDKVKFEVLSTFKSFDQEGYDFTVEAVVPKGFELDKDSEPGEMPMSKANPEAMMTPMAAMVQPKT